jgi:methionyl-tRNA formyltransferase
MEDPVYTLPFIKEIILNRQKDIVGLAVAKGNRLTIGKKKSKLTYLFSLLLIMGFLSFSRFSYKTISFKVKLYLSRYLKLINSPSILEFAKKRNISTWKIKSPNNKLFLEQLQIIKPDIIINQSQSILKKALLEIPSIGVINRHNALLPKNRGRLTPFWVLYKKEKETGVSIHFLEESLDSGDIIVQEKFKVSPNETFASLVKRNYAIAPKAMLKALDKLEKGNYKLIHNDDTKATYNTIPTFKEALTFRWKMFKRTYFSRK